MSECYAHETTAPVGKTNKKTGGSSCQCSSRKVSSLASISRGGLAKPEDRHAAIARLCEQAGGKLVSLHFTLGQYDFIVFSEMPAAKAASVLAFVATGGSGIEGSTTTQAYTTAEARDIFAAAGKIAASCKPMGAS
jgi:uncharacterized protein with GYD domain